MQSTAELVLDARCGVGESPLWSVAEQALYWVDIPAGRLHRWDAQSGLSRHWQAPEMLACLARRGDGPGFVGGMESGLFTLTTPEAAALECHRLAEVAHAAPGMRFNDGRCDRQGRFWAGTMVMDMAARRAAGALYRFDARGLQPMLQGLLVPNGLGFSPDGRTLYLSDSHPASQAIWAFDYDPDDGVPQRQRLWVDMKTLPGRPDGAAVDEDGGYWICANDAGMVHRFTPQGRLDRSLPLPVAKPAMCAFGGAQLDTLYVTTIRPADLAPHEQPLAGAVFALRPGVRGLPEPAFAGPS
ncbi:MAG: SMP-30/gluconolactonase/LRE family protein [Curvibacter sp.]|nr:SMP-30/gluconolactonase/LRE family protein [Curvibacter sp.]